MLLYAILQSQVLIAIASDSYDDSMARSEELFQTSRLDAVSDVAMTFSHPWIVKVLGPFFLRPYNKGNMTEFINWKLKQELIKEARRVGRIQDLTERITTSVTQYVDHKTKANTKTINNKIETEIDDLKELLERVLEQQMQS